MRAISITVILLGLILLGYSVFEIVKVRKYRSDVQEVGRRISELDSLLTSPRVTRLQAPPTEEILAPLNALGQLERSWWAVAIIGGAVIAAGISAIVIERRGAILW